MLYNKNRFKKVNVKKVLHKVKKQWVTISIALLGLLGVKSVATHVNVNADVNSANNDQANHQLKSDQLQSGSSTLVQSNGASLTSASANSSASSVAAPSASVSASSVNSTSASRGNRNYQLTVSSAAQHWNASQTLNVPSAAQSVHNDVLNGYANQAQSDYSPVKNLGLTRVVHHMLGEAKDQQNNTDTGVVGQLMDLINNSVKNGNQSEYSNLMNILSPSNLENISGSHKVSGTTWAGYITNIDNDLNAINSNNQSSVISSLSAKLNGISGMLNGYNNSHQYSISDVINKIRTLSPLIKSLSNNNENEQTLNDIANVLKIANEIPNNSKLLSSYRNVTNDLSNLSNENEAHQADTLSTLSNDVGSFKTALNNDSNISNDLKSAINNNVNTSNLSTAVKNESTSLRKDAVKQDNKQFNNIPVGSLFNDVISYVTSNNDYGKLDSVASDARDDFGKASNASDFINDFVDSLAGLKNANASAIKNDLSGLENNQTVSSLYTIAKSNASSANDILSNLASLNANNAASNLTQVHNDISNNSSFSSISALQNVASSASAEATSVESTVNDANESQAYNSFLKSDEKSLFSDVVNRITASNFNSGAFIALANDAEGDLASASNVNDFVNGKSGFASQVNSIGGFSGATAQAVRSYLTKFADNSEASAAYQSVHADSSDANNILGDLINMAKDTSASGSDNSEADNLSSIANIVSAHFSNASMFGSLASDASSMYTSVSNSVSSSSSASNAAKQAANNKKNGNKTNGNNKQPATPTSINLSNIVYSLLTQVTSPNFDSRNFDYVMMHTRGYSFGEWFGAKELHSLPELWKFIGKDSNVQKAFNPFVEDYENLNNNQKQDINKIYDKVHTNYNIVGPIISVVQQVIDNKKNIKSYLDSIKNYITPNTKLTNSTLISDINSVDSNGTSNIINNIDSFENGGKAPTPSTNSGKKSNSSNGNKTNNKGNNNKPKTPNKPNQPNTPNKKPSNNSNSDVNKLIGDITKDNVEQIANYLSSKQVPNNFVNVVNDLRALPISSTSDQHILKVDNNLDDIKNKLNQNSMPFSKVIVPVINDLVSNDSSNQQLINTFMSGLQSIQNSNDARNDYSRILTDVNDITINHNHEAHDLSDIAKTINKGKGNLKGLHVLKLFGSAAHQVYQPIRKSNKGKQAQDSKRHAKYEADKVQHNKDVARHKQIQIDSAAQSKDNKRHAAYVNAKNKSSADQTHRENMSAVAEADSAARAATAYYRKDSMAAASAQKFAKGLNPGSDSDLASHAASQASGYASLAGTFESEAISADQQAKSDVNNYNAVHTDAETASDKANTTNYLFSGISDQAGQAFTDATAAGYKPASNSTSNNSSSASSTNSSSSATSNSSSASSTNSSTASNSASTSASASNSTSASTSTNSSSTSSSAPSSSASSSVAPSSSASVPASSSNAQSYVPSSTVTPSYTPNVPSSNNNYFPTSNSAVQPTSNDLTVYNSSSAQGSSASAESSSAAVEMTSDTDPNQLSIGQAFESDGAVVARVAPQKHWFNIVNTCLAHNHIGSVGKVKDYGMVMHAGDLAQLEKVFKVTKNGKTYYRYEINVKGHDYYVTGNAKFTRKAYAQPNDMKKAKVFGRRGHHYYEARIVKPCLIHSSVHYTADNGVRSVNKDDIVRIKKAIKIGRKGFGMTRFELIDGTFVTANLDFIELI